MRPSPPLVVAPAAIVLSAALGLVIAWGGSGCADHAGESIRVTSTGRSSGANVVSLGNLRTGRAPSPREIQLAQFFFGVEPDAPLALLKPMELAIEDATLLIAEGAHQTILAWSEATGELAAAAGFDPDIAPRNFTVAANGDRLVVGDDGVVRRCTRSGAGQWTTDRPPEPLRAGGIAALPHAVWVTNVAAHRVEVLDAASGRQLRSFGRRGAGPGEFGLPLGLAVHKDEVFVADMLNARVQVFDHQGTWRRDIGGRGDRPGYFGRPKAVAVGPDGTVFVADAASQSIHAFTPAGRPLRRFGGADAGADALVLPGGLAIWTGRVRAARELPADFTPDYFVLASEQLVQPGVRVYAWRSTPIHDPAAERASRPQFAASVPNPHWRTDGCSHCHTLEHGRTRPLAREAVDALCLSCHDGVRASAEAHPVGRPADTAYTRVPAEWPLNSGRIGCLTCHDIRRHCDAPRRPAVNPALVRGFDARAPLNSCTHCHIAETWRLNPHRMNGPGASSPTTNCGFCHTHSTADATSAFSSSLRAPTTHLCLNCHTMHADPAPDGHLGVRPSAEMRAAMRAAEARHGGASAAATPSDAEPQLLPLEAGQVSCATCHNPHPPDAELGHYFRRPFARSRSTAPTDVSKALRVDHLDLCRHCHPK